MFYLVRVVKIFPEEHSCDCVIMASNLKVAGVKILTSAMNGSDFGLHNQCDPALQPDDPLQQHNTDIRDVYGVMVFADKSCPFIIGFMYPPYAQMLFQGDAYHNFKIDRHGSDLYSTINGLAEEEHYHPSGTYMRLAADLEHVDLTGLDYDALWAITHNIDTAPGARLKIRNGGVDHCILDFLPNGDVELTSLTGDHINITATVGSVNVKAAIDITADAGQNITATAGGNISASAGGSISADAGTSLSATAGTTASITAGTTASVAAGVEISLTAPIITLNTALITTTALIVEVTGIVIAEDFITTD